MNIVLIGYDLLSSVPDGTVISRQQIDHAAAYNFFYNASARVHFFVNRHRDRLVALFEGDHRVKVPQNGFRRPNFVLGRNDVVLVITSAAQTKAEAEEDERAAREGLEYYICKLAQTAPRRGDDEFRPARHSGH